MKRKFFVIAALSAALVFSGCSSADDNTNEDVTTTAAASDIQSEHQETQTIQEQENEPQDQNGEGDISELAKKIYNAAEAYLAQVRENEDEEDLEEFGFNDMKMVFVFEGYLDFDDIAYDLDDVDVQGEIDANNYTVNYVTVTYNGVTKTYPEE